MERSSHSDCHCKSQFISQHAIWSLDAQNKCQSITCSLHWIGWQRKTWPGSAAPFNFRKWTGQLAHVSCCVWKVAKLVTQHRWKVNWQTENLICFTAWLLAKIPDSSEFVLTTLCQLFQYKELLWISLKELEKLLNILPIWDFQCSQYFSYRMTCSLNANYRPSSANVNNSWRDGK